MSDWQKSSDGRTAVVIGGGVIGAACAYYLSGAGWKVTVVERDGFGMGCSHANCGLVSPSHVLPLTMPGAAWKGLRGMVARNAPLSIKLRLDPALWSWLYRFWRRCNTRDMIEGAEGIQPLLRSSRRCYEELMSRGELECEWETRGMLLVFQSREGLEHHRETDHLLRERFGLTTHLYEGDALVELEPALKPGLAGGWHFPDDAHLRPDRLMASWRKKLQLLGVEIREGCAVEGFARERGKARGVITSQGHLKADAFVVATGAMTPFLQKELGTKVPIQPGKGYSITMPRPSRCPAIPMIFDEHSVAVTPMQTGYRLGSTMELAGYDTTLSRRRLDLLRESAALYLHEPTCDPVEEEWFGWRPMTYDSKPIIDRSPAMGNVIVAAGHNMLGVSMAPATGKLVTEILEEREKPHIDPRPYAITRF